MTYQTCIVKFLPSEEGFGFSSTIREDLGHSVLGWGASYSHLKGIAKDFEPVNEWEKTVKERLIRQGVQFV